MNLYRRQFIKGIVAFAGAVAVQPSIATSAFMPRVRALPRFEALPGKFLGHRVFYRPDKGENMAMWRYLASDGEEYVSMSIVYVERTDELLPLLHENAYRAFANVEKGLR